MPASESSKSRISLTKSQLQTEAGAELLALCQAITEDGSLSEQEIGAMKRWLDDNRSADLPSVAFLTATVERIIADGKVTKEERNELYKAVESALPVEARKEAATHRKMVVAGEQERVRAERRAEKQRAGEERERKRPVASANFMVAGVHYEGRGDVIEKYVGVDDQVFLARDRQNRHSRNAVEIRLQNGYQIGFVPEDDACEIAPLLDEGCLHFAFVPKVLKGRRAPIPVVQAYIYRADSGADRAVSQAGVPAKKEYQAGCLSTIVFAVILTIGLFALACIWLSG